MMRHFLGLRGFNLGVGKLTGSGGDDDDMLLAVVSLTGVEHQQRLPSLPSGFKLGKLTGSDDTLLALVAPLVTGMAEARLPDMMGWH